MPHLKQVMTSLSIVFNKPESVIASLTGILHESYMNLKETETFIQSLR